MTIQDLPKSERPRERLESLGCVSLSLRELLEIVMAKGSGNSSVLTVAQDLVSKYPSLESLHQASLKDLQQIKGVGFAKAAQIQAALELGRRLHLESTKPLSKSIFNVLEAYKMCSGYLRHKKKEHLMLFCLDSRMRLCSEPEVISIGNLVGSLIHPREVFEAAIKAHAAQMLLAHNHPSGSSTPSDPDIEVTKQIYDAGKLMGIELVDHIVVCADEYTSIREFAPDLFD
ncbi:MAG: DNA repair protein RadC [Candidatus Doudnabacteria bacterium Gr01-1014_77]|uniref:DNA repair protein RadC n=1 Tax=Candidatus Doudnabacteria bacterium Gr01-1014_77 TaxID=2017133 RepID=A0A554JAN1_9BACT|nr:MAG: DNA repair protein RadC [Candidatus Doudnabacteria bacterium Gr01-1014_77]